MTDKYGQFGPCPCCIQGGPFDWYGNSWQEQQVAFGLNFNVPYPDEFTEEGGANPEEIPYREHLYLTCWVTPYLGVIGEDVTEKEMLLFNSMSELIPPPWQTWQIDLTPEGVPLADRAFLRQTLAAHGEAVDHVYGERAWCIREENFQHPEANLDLTSSRLDNFESLNWEPGPDAELDIAQSSLRIYMMALSNAQTWASGTLYEVGDAVLVPYNAGEWEEGQPISCITEHTSGASFDATERANWETADAPPVVDGEVYIENESANLEADVPFRLVANFTDQEIDKIKISITGPSFSAHASCDVSLTPAEILSSSGCTAQIVARTSGDYAIEMQFTPVSSALHTVRITAINSTSSDLYDGFHGDLVWLNYIGIFAVNSLNGLIDLAGTDPSDKECRLFRYPSFFEVLNMDNPRPPYWEWVDLRYVPGQYFGEYPVVNTTLNNSATTRGFNYLFDPNADPQGPGRTFQYGNCFLNTWAVSPDGNTCACVALGANVAFPYTFPEGYFTYAIPSSPNYETNYAEGVWGWSAAWDEVMYETMSKEYRSANYTIDNPQYDGEIYIGYTKTSTISQATPNFKRLQPIVIVCPRNWPKVLSLRFPEVWITPPTTSIDGVLIDWNTQGEGVVKLEEIEQTFEVRLSEITSEEVTIKKQESIATDNPPSYVICRNDSRTFPLVHGGDGGQTVWSKTVELPVLTHKGYSIGESVSCEYHDPFHNSITFLPVPYLVWGNVMWGDSIRYGKTWPDYESGGGGGTDFAGAIIWHGEATVEEMVGEIGDVYRSWMAHVPPDYTPDPEISLTYGDNEYGIVVAINGVEIRNVTLPDGLVMLLAMDPVQLWSEGPILPYTYFREMHAVTPAENRQVPPILFAWFEAHWAALPGVPDIDDWSWFNYGVIDYWTLHLTVAEPVTINGVPYGIGDDWWTLESAHAVPIPATPDEVDWNNAGQYYAPDAEPKIITSSDRFLYITGFTMADDRASDGGSTSWAISLEANDQGAPRGWWANQEHTGIWTSYTTSHATSNNADQLQWDCVKNSALVEQTPLVEDYGVIVDT